MTIYDRFFQLAKARGLEEAEINVSKSSSTSISVFNHEIENFSVNENTTYLFRGIKNGKFGTCTSTTLTKDNLENIVDNIIVNSQCIEKEGVAELFKGSEKYRKVNTYNKDLSLVSINKKKEDLFALEKAIEEASPLVSMVEGVSYNEASSENLIFNTLGLKLKQKSNYFVVYAGVVCKKDNEVETGGDLFLDNDYSKYDVNKLAKKIVDETTSKLGGKPVESGKKKIVLSADCASTLIDAYVSNANAERVQKHTSLFEGKLNQKVASRKITIADKPLAKTIHAKWFDDEGVACENKDIIKNGKLMTYLYNLETAKKDNVKSTGNGVNSGVKMAISPFYLEVKPGKKSLDELFETVGEGLYITDLQGANAGLNATSGNFSLKASGYLIEGGKIVRPVNLITVSGNLVTLFNDVTEVGNDVRIYPSGVSTPSLIIKSLSVGGK